MKNFSLAAFKTILFTDANAPMEIYPASLIIQTLNNPNYIAAKDFIGFGAIMELISKIKKAQDDKKTNVLITPAEHRIITDALKARFAETDITKLDILRDPSIYEFIINFERLPTVDVQISDIKPSKVRAVKKTG